MITLTTGQPGAGKSLYTLYYVKTLAEKEGREVYYNGIPDLKLPWVHLDDPAKWYELPAGAIIVLDECQRLFRPRGTGSQVPEYVAKLETHRHNGHDLFLITQHPMLVDTNVRRLIGRHFHVQRTFGMQRATVHEFPDLRQEPDKSRDGSVRHEFAYPKEVFTWYKSAEVHTVKRRIPMRVWLLLMVPFLLAALVWATVSWWQGKMAPANSGSGVAAPVAVEASFPNSSIPPSSTSRALSPRQYIEWQSPRIPGLAYTAPMYDSSMQVKTAPFPSICAATSSRCQCYTDQGTKLDVDDRMCRDIVDNGFFDPRKDAQLTGSEPLHQPLPVTDSAGVI